MKPDWTPKPIGDPDWQDVILFDGVCIFCSRWVAFVIARDVGHRFRFAPIQFEPGGAIAARFGISREAPETNAVIIDGTAYFKSDAAIAVLRRLPGWSWTGGLALFPRLVRNLVYDLIATNRYRIFGRADACIMPSPDVRARFLINKTSS